MTTTDHASARRTTCVVAALARLLGEQLGVGEPGDDAGLARRAGSPRRRPAGRHRRRGPPRRRRRSARCRAGAARARSRRAGVAPDGQTAGQLAHGRSVGVGHVREGVGTVHEPEVVGAARAGRRPCRRPGRPATNSSPGTQSVWSSRHMCTVESAEWARLSPITKMWPSGTGPAVQSQAGHRPVAGDACPRADVVVLVERLAVDRDPALLVAALDRVALDADDPLHQVAARRGRARSWPSPWRRVVGPADSAAPSQPPGSLKTTTSPRCGLAAEPVGQLLHQDPVVLDQARLHRLRRDVEGLDEERLDHDREHQGDAEQQDRLLPQRQVLLRGLGVVRWREDREPVSSSSTVARSRSSVVTRRA